LEPPFFATCQPRGESKKKVAARAVGKKKKVEALGVFLQVYNSEIFSRGGLGTQGQKIFRGKFTTAA